MQKLPPETRLRPSPRRSPYPKSVLKRTKNLMLGARRCEWKCLDIVEGVGGMLKVGHLLAFSESSSTMRTKQNLTFHGFSIRFCAGCWLRLDGVSEVLPNPHFVPQRQDNRCGKVVSPSDGPVAPWRAAPFSGEVRSVDRGGRGAWVFAVRPTKRMNPFLLVCKIK